VRIADDVDSLIGVPGYVGITAPGGFAPTTNIAHARQRWLFRMVHSPAPLQEKLALFWHNHFATAYSKISNASNGFLGTRMLALKPGELPGPPGQIELFRSMALGIMISVVFVLAATLTLLPAVLAKLARSRP